MRTMYFSLIVLKNPIINYLISEKGMLPFQSLGN